MRTEQEENHDISDEDIFARKFANEFAFHSLNHIFEEEFGEKLSKYEKIFVNLHQKDASLLTLDRIDASIILFSLNRSLVRKYIELCTISDCQTKRF